MNSLRPTPSRFAREPRLIARNGAGVPVYAMPCRTEGMVERTRDELLSAAKELLGTRYEPLTVTWERPFTDAEFRAWAVAAAGHTRH